MPRGDALTIASDLIQGGLLLVATAAFLANTSRLRCATLHIRLFWILMSVGMIFWLTYQGCGITLRSSSVRMCPIPSWATLFCSCIWCP